MDETVGTTGIDLRDYLRILRTRKWSVIASVVVVVGLALVMSSLSTPLYQARTRVLVEASQGFEAQPGFVNIQTEVEVVSSEAVAALAKEQLDTPLSLDGILAGLQVAGIQDTTILALTYTSPDPAFSRDAADAFAENYIEYRRTQALQELITEQEAIEQRIEAASTQLQELGEQIADAERAEDTALATTLETSRSILTARLGVLQQNMDDLQAARVATDSGEVIEPATLPSRPSSPDLKKNAMLALFIGLALGIGVALLRERLDDRLKGREDIQRAVQAPILATVPQFKSTGRRLPEDLIIQNDPTGPASEAYRSLRTGLQFIASRQGIKSILVTSPGVGEGKTMTVSNLGVALAQAGTRVILVSSDLRRPTLERYFGLDHREPGLSTWLAGQTNALPDIVQDPGVDNLRLIGSGPIPPNPGELLTSGRLNDLLRTLEENSDLVIFDSPPVLAVTDAAIVAPHVGGTLLIVNASKTHRSAAVHARDELTRLGGRLLGCAVNSYDTSTSHYYQPYSYYSPVEPGDGQKNGAGQKSKRKRSVLGRRRSS